MEPLFFFLTVFFGIFGAYVFLKLLLKGVLAVLSERRRKR